jgi:DNA-binding beta-propeller fold protein YncE
VIALAIAAAAALAQPHVVATVPPEHRLVEGVATNGRSIWVSSVIDRQILECTGNCRPIVTLPAGLSPLGIAWDWSRDLLWVAADCPDLPGVAKCSRGALLAVSPAGRIVWRLSPQGEFHPGDVSVSLHAVFVSDSRNGLVYALLPRRAGLRAVNRAADGRSAQGTALTPDGTHVVVADYSRGIGRIDIKSGATTWLPRQDGKALRGIDGLVRCGDRYFGIYNASSPGRVLSIAVGPAGISTHELEAAPALPDPTQIAFDGKRLVAIANAGWQGIARAGERRTEPTRIFAIPLPHGCSS